MLKTIQSIFKKKEAGKHPLYNEFMQWQMHGIGNDVLVEGLRPEYAPYVAQARVRAAKARARAYAEADYSQPTEEEILAKLEDVLQELKA